MDEGKIPFNMDWEFKEDLREHALNPEEMQKGVAFLLKNLEGSSLDDSMKAKMLSMLGIYERILGKYEDSEKHLDISNKLFLELKDKRNFIIGKLRQAHTLQWMGKFSRAEKIFREFLLKSSEDSTINEFEDFILQHLGICFFDQKMLTEAQGYFLQALELRVAKGNKELIESTNFALKVTQDILNPEKEELEEEEFDPSKV